MSIGRRPVKISVQRSVFYLENCRCSSVTKLSKQTHVILSLKSRINSNFFPIFILCPFCQNLLVHISRFGLSKQCSMNVEASIDVPFHIKIMRIFQNCVLMVVVYCLDTAIKKKKKKSECVWRLYIHIGIFQLLHKMQRHVSRIWREKLNSPPVINALFP